MIPPQLQSVLTPEFVRAELDRLEPILHDMGLRAPFRRARMLAQEEQVWEAEAVQACWRSRLAFWRRVLTEKGGAADWSSILDLDRPTLAPIRGELEAGGLRARAAWVRQIRIRVELRDLLRNEVFAKMLFEADEWGLYDEDGGFRFDRPEGLTRGEIRLLALEPVCVPSGEDYDWTFAHPRDRLFQYQSQSAYHLC